MSQNNDSFKHLSIRALQEILNDKTHVIVDIRDQASYQAAHIPESLHLTNENLADFLHDADLDAPVVVCCYHGISSQQAAQFLISQDFTEVYSLDGGFTEWQQHYPDLVSSS